MIILFVYVHSRILEYSSEETPSSDIQKFDPDAIDSNKKSNSNEKEKLIKSSSFLDMNVFVVSVYTLSFLTKGFLSRSEYKYKYPKILYELKTIRWTFANAFQTLSNKDL